ncbi:unnamed protein product [Penicillium salamii]|nr:unnamed protein product [Penicillium salamii]CAG8251482.1 unnamed protein product [Penicillium salamii]
MWFWLEGFWGEEKVAKWQELLVEGSGMNVNQVYNLITLDLHIHKYWDQGLVALRPVWRNEDETEMQIAVHWLPAQRNFGGMSPSDYVPINTHPLQHEVFRPYETPGDNHYIHACREDGSIFMVTSGDIFTLKTTNRKEQPLPSFELLELRWHLSRIAVMQGRDEDKDEDSDDEHVWGCSIDKPSCFCWAK